MDIVYILLVGGVAGWAASVALKGKSLGAIGNIVIGICGSLVGSYLFPMIGFHVIIDGLLGQILHAAIGAALLLIVIGIVSR